MKRTALPAPLARHLVGAGLVLPLALGGLGADSDPAAEPKATSPAAGEKAASGESAEKEAAEKEAGAATSGDLKNWVEFGVGGTLFNGRRAAYQQRTGLPDGAFGGIEGFHFEQVVGEEGRFRVEGRGIFDNHDYALRFDLTLPEKGFLRAGYREYRHWSDPAGGWFPPTQGWYDLYSGALAYDEREVFVEAGLRLPKVPQFTLRYSHSERDGQKDSTIWGETSQTGDRGPRSIVPGIYDLNRIRDLVMADLAHTLGKTRVGVGFRYERQDNDDARWLRRYPGEGPADDRYVTQRDRATADLFGAHATTETPLSDRVKFTAAYGYTDLNSDLGGYRVYGAAFDPDLAQRLPAAGTYENLVGGSLMRQHVGNLNLMARLTDVLVLVPSVRVESRQTDSESVFDAPAAPFSPSTYAAASERSLLDVAEALEARYTGLTNWVFYARGWWLQGSGDLDERLANRTTATEVLFRSTDDNRHAQKYTAGANWYPLRRLSLGAEYYRKIRENDYDHLRDSTPNGPDSINRLPAYLRAQEFTTDDVNCRVTWRPRANLTLVGRYDLQLSEVETRADGRPQLESADLTSHIGSGSVSWVPWARLYLQGTLSYVYDRTETPAAALVPAVQNAENDYWTAQVTAGLACDDRTDLELQYVYYRADNYADNSEFGQPYGAGAEEHGISAGLVRRLSARVQLALRYGFYTSRDALAGGQRDYDAHLIYSTLRYRF
jgi:hypothetical protein